MKMLTAAMFVVVGSRDNLSIYHTERRLSKTVVHTHSTEYNAAFGSKELDVHVETQVYLKNSTQRKKKQNEIHYKLKYI